MYKRQAQKATEFRRSEELTGLLEEGVLCPGLDVLYQTCLLYTSIITTSANICTKRR